MEKVVPLFKPFNFIFYFKFFRLRKIIFRSVKVWMSLNFEFESFDRFGNFKTRHSGRAHASAPHPPLFGRHPQVRRPCAPRPGHCRPPPAGRAGPLLHLLTAWHHPEPDPPPTSSAPPPRRFKSVERHRRPLFSPASPSSLFAPRAPPHLPWLLVRSRSSKPLRHHRDWGRSHHWTPSLSELPSPLTLVANWPPPHFARTFPVL
jgi:hypothetical protein